MCMINWIMVIVKKIIYLNEGFLKFVMCIGYVNVDSYMDIYGNDLDSILFEGDYLKLLVILCSC